MNKGSVLKRELKVPKDNISKAHLLIINNLLPNKLTDQEIDILDSFINLDDKIVEVDGRFGLLGKRKVKELSKISSSHLSNIIRSLKEKNCVYESDGILNIRPHLFLKPTLDEDYYVEYNFILKANEKKS